MPPRWTDQPELMDRPGHDPTILADNLDDLRRVNRWLGGASLTIYGVERLAAQLGPGEALRVIDVATGGADIPRALERWARRRGLRPVIVASDVSVEILSLAGPPRGAALVAADARSLPFADETFDVATCSLALHHFVPGEAVELLRELRRVSRLGVVLNDIVRCWHGYVGAWVLSRTLSGNPLTLHDGPLSVRRAFTRDEMLELVARAGLRPVGESTFLGYRRSFALRAA